MDHLARCSASNAHSKHNHLEYLTAKFRSFKRFNPSSILTHEKQEKIRIQKTFKVAVILGSFRGDEKKKYNRLPEKSQQPQLTPLPENHNQASLESL